MLIIDLFAGGGGASAGIRAALGRDPDIAVNHDRVAIAMHEANHPGTAHYPEDIWKVPPRRAVGKNQVALLHASPDCTHFSKAKGNAPKRDLMRRSLAWVVEKWMREVRPRVVTLENVEEFTFWGPLDSEGKVIASQKGTTFAAFIRRIKRLGYQVEWKELRACDYGAPTIRRRLFLIARCDGLPIVWPEPTHGPGIIPYRTAADIIDWSIPVQSIFDRKRPLAENTLRRIAKGIQKYVVETGEPFIVPIQHYNGSNPAQSINKPLRTVTASPKGGGFALAVPTLIQTGWGERKGQAPRVPGLEKPLGTIMATGIKHALVAAFMTQYNGGFYDGAGRDLRQPVSTIMQSGSHQQLVSAFMVKYYGTDQDPQMGEPLHTITTRDRFGLVTVNIQGEPYVITDIGMRMLSPRELFRAQGFDDDYKIDITHKTESGKVKRITKTDQVRLCGNSVCPPVAAALIEANLGVKTRSSLRSSRHPNSISGTQ